MVTRALIALPLWLTHSSPELLYNTRCVKADIIPQHLPSADLGPYMRTHIETTAVGGRVR